jgi:hypothetical protein
MAVSAATTKVAEQNVNPAAFLRSAGVFVAIGVVLYVCLFAVAEWLVYRHGDRNRFFMVRTAPATTFDVVVLGASHAAVFDFGDMNARLEGLTGKRILNLSVVGGGIVVNRLLLDYFLTRHRADTIVYVVDSFAFYSREWNEERLEDARLFHRAPFDPALAALLARSGASWRVPFDYVTGFSKINNADRFAPDVPAEASRFDRRYRPIEQLDRQRIDYLYPAGIDETVRSTRQRYFSQFEALVAAARERGSRVVLLRPPLPPRTRTLIPGEGEFDAALRDLAARTGAELHDLSGVADDPALYFDSDHLNRTGVLQFYGRYLAGILGK